MSGEDTARPQDVGRRHRRAGRPSAETASLLARYQAAMRDDLASTLDELAPKASEPGLGLVDAPPARPAIPDRIRLWELAIKLGRELGTAIDPDPAPDPAGPATTGRRRRVDYG